MITPRTIPLPSYLLDDAELIDLYNRLREFATGNPDVVDDPCERAEQACHVIAAILQERGQPIDNPFT